MADSAVSLASALPHARELAADGQPVTLIQHMTGLDDAATVLSGGVRELNCRQPAANPSLGFPGDAAVYLRAAPATIIQNWSRGANGACAALVRSDPYALRVLDRAQSAVRNHCSREARVAARTAPWPGRSC
jgi:hypothetical protein